MSTVTPPEYFGEQYASDVIRRQRQKILVLRETATSYTWAKLIKSETAAVLEAGLRSLFGQVRPPNAARPASCRLDNAAAFQTLALNDSLENIGVKLDLSNAANINGNPVAEKANRELEKCIIVCQPAGGRITSSVLASAVSMLNARPRWSTMSARELWTGKDPITGHTLVFDQKHIIAQQHKRRLNSHPVVTDSPLDIQPGDLVFNNDEGSKLKARDKLIVRENLGGGMFRLDRLHEATGNVTRAFLPARLLYKPAPRLPPPEEPQPLQPDDSHLKDIIAPDTELEEVTQTPEVIQPPVPINLPTPRKCNRQRVPVAPGKSYDYTPPSFATLHRPFFFTSGEPEPHDFVPSIAPVIAPDTGNEPSDDDIESPFVSASEHLTDTSSPSNSTNLSTAPPSIGRSSGSTQTTSTVIAFRNF